MEPVEINLFPERAVVRQDAVSEVDAVVEVTCRPGASRDRPAGPMNLCLVIDRSGSMSGPKLTTAINSCIDVFGRLGPNDLLTVVTFDTQAQVIINPQTPRDQVKSRLRAVESGGMTDLSLGWYQGLLELQTQTTESYYNRLFLLSDGQANQGETKRAAFADTASRARDVGITASTIGIGRDFQEDLLEAIASSSGGRFWNISESDIEDIIEEEFQGALSVQFDRPRVVLTLPAGVRISRELNQLSKTSRGYRLRPLQREDTFNFALRLEIDPEEAGDGPLTLGATLLDGEREIVAVERELTFGSRQDVAASPVHPIVRSTVQQFETSTADESMLADLEAGRVTEFRQMLTSEIARLQTEQEQIARVDDAGWEQLGLSPTRGAMEMGHLFHYSSSMTVLDVAFDMIEPYQDEPLVRAFMSSARKHLMREGARNDRRDLSPTPWDDDAPIVLEALALADVLIDQHPEDTARLDERREMLREFLDHR